MDLKLKRSQQKGFTGAISFTLFAMLDLSKKERTVIHDYQLGDTLLYASESGMNALSNFTNSNSFGSFALSLGAAFFAKASKQLITVDMLVTGKQFNTKKINDLIVVEEEIRVACDNLARIMATCYGFGGEEIISIAPFEGE